ncbi:hypothetical protein QR680_001862 [Steinernema hermaphroditum]|uniref:Uncharacterized protein n=1 Tax=Steinernema hermaphroditum TaxID=289476 RepID=A0AA39LGW0_9BILA|nr:hypothetical protein QR680_001862 [Steinernema hermaphroditum]
MVELNRRFTLAASGHSVNHYPSLLVQAYLQQIQQQGSGLWRGKEETLDQGTAAPAAVTPTFCNGCRELRKDIEVVKEILIRHLQHHTDPDANALSLLMNRNRVNSTSTATECPLALLQRPVPQCGLPTINFANAWGISATAAPGSPTLPQGIFLDAQQTQENNWSSPSSVGSTNKTDSSNGESSAHIDPVGLDTNEAPSTSGQSAQQLPLSATAELYKELAKQSLFGAPNSNFNAALLRAGVQFPAAALGSLHSAERAATTDVQTAGAIEKKFQKPISDDYVKIIRQQNFTPERAKNIEVPVREAFICDPHFLPAGEKQIIDQVLHGKNGNGRFDVREAMTVMCKKLAEKRVFGPKLMAKTTVAGPNHSTYNNLPDSGIHYIQSVCWEVFGPGKYVKDDEEFWDLFKDAMRKLAARCRRVRHAKKKCHQSDSSLLLPRHNIRTLASQSEPNIETANS